jgi:hypothetical protein
VQVKERVNSTLALLRVRWLWRVIGGIFSCAQEHSKGSGNVHANLESLHLYQFVD